MRLLRVVLLIAGAVYAVVLASALGAFGSGGDGSSSASAYEYSTTITTTTTTSTTTSTSTSTTTTTPTSTKPGKGCGDKNHLHERRFECKVVIANAKVKEGNAGTSTLQFLVQLSDLPLSEVTVSYATVPGTAASGTDFALKSGTVTFPAGVMTRAVNVAVVGDRIRERDETLSVYLANPSPNAYLGIAKATGTIVNDD